MPARCGVKNLHVSNKSLPDIMMLAFSHAKYQFCNFFLKGCIDIHQSNSKKLIYGVSTQSN